MGLSNAKKYTQESWSCQGEFGNFLCMHGFLKKKIEIINGILLIGLLVYQWMLYVYCKPLNLSTAAKHYGTQNVNGNKKFYAIDFFLKKSWALSSNPSQI